MQKFNQFKVFVILLLIFLPINVLGIELTNNQLKNLQIAYNIGNKVEWRGEKYGETVASILWQESHAGSIKFQNKGIILGDINSKGKPKSLGLMQVQLQTAKDVIRWYPYIKDKHCYGKFPTDEFLILKLLTDDKFNIEIGSLYYKKMLELKKDWSDAILSYNIGPNGIIDINDYLKKVKNNRLEIILPNLQKIKGE